MQSIDAETTRKINDIIEMIWPQFDTNGDGVLDKAETRVLVSQLLEYINMPTDFTDNEFEECFGEIDLDGNGVIEKEEMNGFLRNFVGVLTA